MTDIINIKFVSRDSDIVESVKNKLGKHAGYKFSFSSVDIENIDDMQYDVCVSTANSYGEIQGGIDMKYYMSLGGKKLQQYIYNVIMKNYAGEILVGESCLIDLNKVRELADQDNDNTTDVLPRYLLLCPTMTLPGDVSNTRNAYYFTRAMIRGLKNMQRVGIKFKTVICPVPCVAVGMMDPIIAANQISIAFDAFDKKGLMTSSI